MPVTLQLLPIYSKNQIGNFNLDSFARGDMIGSSNGGGGMI